MFTLKHSYKTDVGKVRSHNEDAVQIFQNDQLAIMVIADGMGGHAAGDIASKMAITAVAEQFRHDLNFSDKEAVGEWINKLFIDVNTEIYAFGKKINARQIGTTMVVTVITKDFITFASVGDSRAYVLAYDKLRQITKDHTFVRELVEKGHLSERAAKIHPNKNVINKALGAAPKLEYDFLTLENYDLDAVLLCTDGLTNLVEDQEVLAVLKTDIKTEEKTLQLIEKANARGGRDNVSIALIEFMKESGE